jgi:hypothetical protein
VFVTFNGGGRWTDISTGLDGSPVKQIVTNPLRGTFDAYAVTAQGVYHLVGLSRPTPNINSPIPAGAHWVNITANLFGIQRLPFAETDPNAVATQTQFTQTVLAAKATNPLTSIVADWRFKVPDAPGSTTFHPVLYVGGYGGVFRSMDNGKTWTSFPDTSDGSPVNGGYLPAVPVTSLSLSAGNIDPTSGLPSACRSTASSTRSRDRPSSPSARRPRSARVPAWAPAAPRSRSRSTKPSTRAR